MNSLVSDLGVGVLAFAATNIDDIFLLAAFFSDATMRPRSIVVGQYLGIGALVLASALAAMLSLAFPEGWVALLGLVPLVLGINRLLELRTHGQEAEDSLVASSMPERGAGRGTRSQVLTIAGVTIANGGDNVGVYVPLFASDTHAMALHALTFAVMTGLWCALGYRLVNNRFIGDAIKRRAHVALPVVLILLGVYILAGARVLVTGHPQ